MAVGVATVWTLGILSLTGGRATALTSILPSLILVVGMATGVHVAAQFREERFHGAEPREAARRAPRDAEARLLLARILRQTGKLEAALAETESLRTIAALAPTVPRERAEILVLLAARALEEGDRTLAVRRAREALAENAERIEAGSVPFDGRLLRLVRAAADGDAGPELLAALAEAATASGIAVLAPE